MLKRTFRQKKESDNSPLPNWPEDDDKVRNGTCSFDVRYIGSIEVFESSGIQVCEDAAKALKTQCKGKFKKAVLHVSGDTLRVVDDTSKGLIIDQAVERVSFCSPDRHQEKGFAYICRDGATKRWMCHAFLSVKEPGERLSHAVGCAFNVCLEKKQQREKENAKVAPTATNSDSKTSFTHTGSFRHVPLSERLADPQSTIIPGSVAVKPSRSIETVSVERPKASANMLLRGSSFKGVGHLADTSMFKRQSSLRVNDLPSTVDRQKQLPTHNMDPRTPVCSASGTLPAIASSSTITQMCQQLQTLAALSTDDPFAQLTSTSIPLASQSNENSWEPNFKSDAIQHSQPTSDDIFTGVEWSPARPSSRRLSDADQWLEQITSSMNLANTAASSSNSKQPLTMHPSPRTRSHSVGTSDYSLMDRAYKQSVFSESRNTQSHNDNYYGSSDPFDVSWVKRTPASSKPGATVGFCQAGANL